MTEMVDRIAHVLEQQAWRALGLCDTLAYKNRRESSVRKARAVLAAMREPTTAIIRAAGMGFRSAHDAVGFTEQLRPSDTLITAEVWRAMIDAAPGEAGKGSEKEKST